MNKKNHPLVSVVTPVHNGGKFLEECIQSVLDQTYPNWEFIILNNYSTDNTLAIAEKYAKKCDRLRIYNTDTLLPIMKNWNLALSKISPESKYCKVVHADDFLFPNCIERMVSLAEASSTIGVVGSYGLWGNSVVCDGLPYSTKSIPGKELCRLTLLNKLNCFWSPSSLLIRSDMIRNRRNFYNEKHLHADVEACYEVLQESDFAFVHQVLTFIRRHEESVTNVVATPFNKTILFNLDLFLKYGPVFLSKKEYKKQLDYKMRKYYKFISLSLFQLREKDFWCYHRDTINEMGIKIKYSKLIYSVFYRLIAYPKDTASTLISSLRLISNH
jgi:glycosyltransferase involved in cell wall biosynthesis